MVNRNLYIDISGSVNNSKYYWSEVNKIVEQYKSTINKYYLWNDNVKLVSYEEVQTFITDKIGNNGTFISNVAKYISYENEPLEIILITDGEVTIDEVKISEKYLMDSTNIQHAYCYIINDDEKYNNISVILPFVRKTNSDCYITSSNYHKSYNIKDFDVLDKFENLSVDEIYNNFDHYYDLVNIKNMGLSGLPDVKHHLLKIRNEFIKIANKKLNNDLTLLLQEEIKKGDYDTSRKLINDIDIQFFKLEDNSIISKFNKLITLCVDRRMASFSIKTENAKNSENIQPDISEVDISKYDYEDPILLDIDIPQLVIVEGDTIFDDESNLKNFIENPLSILYNDDIKDKIAKRLGHIVGIKTTASIKFDPFTRKKIIGTIPLTVTNEQHLKVGNYALYALFTNKKIMGNSSLYYIILWQIIKENRLPFLNENMDFITNHLKYRLENSRTYISLSGLTGFNRTLAPVDVALYYVLNSNDVILRKHIFNSEVIMDILTNVFRYKISYDRLTYIYKTKIALSMLSLIKKDSSDFHLRIKCLTNDYYETDKQIIPIDYQISDNKLMKILNTFPDYYKKVSINDLVYLSTLVNPNYSASYIVIKSFPYDYLFKYEWKDYNLNTEELKISINTFRPYYYSNWKEKAKIRHNIDVDSQVSAYNDFIRCYLSLKKFPNYYEFAAYSYKRYKKPIHYRLPEMYSIVLMSYDPIMKYIKDNNMGFLDVRKRLLDSCKISNRITIQELA